MKMNPQFAAYILQHIQQLMNVNTSFYQNMSAYLMRLYQMMGQGHPFLQFNPYTQVNPHVEVNPYLQMNPYLQLNPYLQVNPNIQSNIELNPDLDLYISK